MDDLDNSTTSQSESIISNKLRFQISEQQNQIKVLQQNYSSLQSNHIQLQNYVKTLSNAQNNLQQNVAYHRNELDTKNLQWNYMSHKMNEINSLVEDFKIKNQEQKFINSDALLRKYYNTIQSTLSHCYCQCVVIKSKNVILDSQTLLVSIGINLLALIPVVGYTLSSSVQVINQTLEDSELVKKSTIFVQAFISFKQDYFQNLIFYIYDQRSLASSQSDFDIIAEFVSRKLTLIQQKELKQENFKIDNKLFDSWIEGFDVILQNLGITKIEHFAHLQANYLASYYIQDQKGIQEKYQSLLAQKERSQLLIDIIINSKNYTVDDKYNKEKDMNCECELPCYIF